MHTLIINLTSKRTLSSIWFDGRNITDIVQKTLGIDTWQDMLKHAYTKGYHASEQTLRVLDAKGADKMYAYKLEYTPE